MRSKARALSAMRCGRLHYLRCLMCSGLLSMRSLLPSFLYSLPRFSIQSFGRNGGTRLMRPSARTLVRFLFRSRKEVFQPHLPVRLPCYDLAPVTRLALGRSLRSRPSGTPDSHGLTGGVYKARERIHRAMADARLLANPASRSRVADSDPN
jgi:hypothetical protein